MDCNRRFLKLGLALVLAAGVSCTSSDGGPTGVPTEQPSQSLGGLIDDLGGVLDLGGTTDDLGGTVDDLGGTVDEVEGSTVEGTDLLDGVVGGAGTAAGGVLGAAFEVTNLLTCTEQKYVEVRQTVGRRGGKIKVGDHTLEIPEGALSRDIKIKAEQMPGSTNSVRFSPEGLRFQKPAALTMSYRNCLVVLLPKKIVYTTEKFKILEVIQSIDLFNKKKVTAPIDHFSRYAVAY